MDQELKNKLTAGHKWIRALFMLIFMLIGYFLAPILIFLIAVFQFVFTLFANQPNENLLKFSNGICEYFSQIMHYLTYDTENKPFPFGKWPESK
jgi:hypothetical protein